MEWHFLQSRVPLLAVLIVLIVLSLPLHTNADVNSLNPVEQDLEDIKPACEQSDTTEYFTCIKTYNERLKKRDAIKISDLEACAATRKKCLTICSNNMKRNIECNTDNCPICPTVQLIEGKKRIIVEGESSSYKYEMPITPGQNITTIIKLTNIINNTNVMDIPTNINSTNVNNIFIFNNETSDVGGNYGLGYTKGGSCCLAVQPKTCRATSAGVRCHHKRHKTCGPQCVSRVIHAQSRQRCRRGTDCQVHVGYVPQPRQPRCVYTSEWPHVSCGGHYQRNCDGCYDHYGYGASKYYEGERHPRHCTGCYDDAFDMGPLYRRGPVFRPFYYHQPPCFFTGTCGMPMCNYYGCFGDEMTDPTFGLAPYPGYGRQPDYGDDLEFTNHIERNNGNDTSISDQENNESWGVQVYKCKVVGESGAVEIKNCTNDELEGNPFASSPSDYPYYPPQPNESPDYQINPFYADKRTMPERFPFPKARKDSIYDDYISEEEENDRSRRRAGYQHKRKTHKKRKVQIVYDDEDAEAKTE